MEVSQELQYFSNFLLNFDKKHEDYRDRMALRFMRIMTQKFVNRFEFQGDPLFTRETQRTFMKILFEHGYSSITNPLLNQTAIAQILETIPNELPQAYRERFAGMVNYPRLPLISSQYY